MVNLLENKELWDAQKVKRFRSEEMRVSQRAFASMLGTTHRTVQNWEKGSPINDKMQSLLDAKYQLFKAENAAPQVMAAPSGDGSSDKFFAALERQQDIMSRQLEELVEMRKLAQKKDEQIDLLLNLIKGK